MLNTYYANTVEVFQEIRRHCSESFYKRHAEQIYRCYRGEYEPLFGERAFNDIKKIVQDFKDFYGEE